MLFCSSFYEYDHRSLSETLDEIDFPADLEATLGDNTTTVAKLIKAGKASGPIVDQFKQIQIKEGDDAAFEFLRAEADGFHSTPYGHCINSFTVDPCPKNLECFAGCKHLTATPIPSKRKNLEKLAERYEVALTEIQARPINTIGHSNQIAHATVRLESIRKLLQTKSGQQVFPNGPDLSLKPYTRSLFDD